MKVTITRTNLAGEFTASETITIELDDSQADGHEYVTDLEGTVREAVAAAPSVDEDGFRTLIDPKAARA